MPSPRKRKRKRPLEECSNTDTPVLKKGSDVRKKREEGASSNRVQGMSRQKKGVLIVM